MELAIRAATIADSQLNRQLADDERSRNTMSVAALAERMETWLAADWQAVLFEESSRPLGYTTHKHAWPSLQTDRRTTTRVRLERSGMQRPSRR